MTADPDLAIVAALIGDPTRASILLELMHGRALTATELATRAEVVPSTASGHLARLVGGGLLTCVAQGRHRYYRLASTEVARVIEALGVLSPPAQSREPDDSEPADGLRFARTCYDHLAGRLGVSLADALVARHYLRAESDEYRLTDQGEVWLTRLGVDLAATRRARRAFARPCLDWTERRMHLAGALGRALLVRLVQIGWLARYDDERTVLLTPLGQAGLHAELGLQMHPATHAGIPSVVGLDRA
jgi:DNA-binding transcriptional ArsR family regulator